MSFPDINGKLTEKLIKSVIIPPKSKIVLSDKSYQIKILGINYLDQIMELHQLIIDRLIRKDTLEPFTTEFMKEHLGNKGFIIGADYGKKLIAFRNVYFPDINEKEWNLGIDLGFDESILHKVANLQMVCVHPVYRGNSLALIMNGNAIRIIKSLGKYDHICATVSPYNYWNLRILFDSGFVVKKLTTKYNGKLRYIVHRNLKETQRFDPVCHESVVLTDFTKQYELLNKGWYGTGLIINNESAGPNSYEKMLFVFCKQT
ncbi:hypothetical protein [Desulfobacterium sp. N47]|uniref:hypothetical protein n=1 Tax=Desulfobacterium sp. N47 TaxID=3115210 RepID=UPI003CA46F9A